MTTNLNYAELMAFKERVEFHAEIASKIMDGEHEGYDGADGARYILELTRDAAKMIAALEELLPK